MKIFAHILSLLFHPILFPTYGATLLIATNPHRFGYFGDRVHVAWLIIIFALTFLFPSIWLLMMKRLEMVDSLKLETSKERIVPFIATATFYLWCAWMFKPNTNMKIPANELLFYMMLGSFMAIAIAFFINIFSKTSLHAIAAGSLFGLILIIVRMSPYDLRAIFVGIILLCGLIGAARLVLEQDSQREVFSGYLIGFSSQFAAFILLPKLF